VSLLAARRIWIAGALFLLGAKRSSLSLARSLDLIALFAQLLDLCLLLGNRLLQLLNSGRELTDLPGLPENDLNQRVGIIPQTLKNLSELSVRIGMID
jgi:hypothetical protein